MTEEWTRLNNQQSSRTENVFFIGLPANHSLLRHMRQHKSKKIQNTSTQ